MKNIKNLLTTCTMSEILNMLADFWNEAEWRGEFKDTRKVCTTYYRDWVIKEYRGDDKRVTFIDPEHAELTLYHISDKYVLSFFEEE